MFYHGEIMTTEYKAMLPLIGSKIVSIEWNVGKKCYYDSVFMVAEGGAVEIADKSHQCCEARWMTTDDDLQYFVGAKVLGLEVLNAPDGPTDSAGSVHEVKFLNLTTSKGVITFQTHNEHNGYYGGFDVAVDAITEW